MVDHDAVTDSERVTTTRPSRSPESDSAMRHRLRQRLFGDQQPGEAHGWKQAPADLSGFVLDGKYEVGELLGAGGMGLVYGATHLRIGKRVAVKILKPEFGKDPEFYARFVREAKSASRIDHPNVVGVSDMGEFEGVVYYVMDYLQGEDLRGVLRRQKRVSWAELRQVALELLDGLSAAHARGVVHRDLKPDNVFLVETSTGRQARILDFGIARVLRADESGSSLTKDGKILGSPRYMPPEQALGGQPDERSDIYSVGVLLYEALAGVAPFVDRSMFKLLKMQVESPVPRFSEKAPGLDVDPRLEHAIRKAMNKEPDDRFQSAAELSAALRAVVIDAESASESTKGLLDARLLAGIGIGLGVAAVIYWLLG